MYILYFYLFLDVGVISVWTFYQHIKCRCRCRPREFNPERKYLVYCPFLISSKDFSQRLRIRENYPSVLPISRSTSFLKTTVKTRIAYEKPIQRAPITCPRRSCNKNYLK